MLGFRDISLRGKQTLIIMLTSSIVLLLACVAFVAYDTFSFRHKLVQSVSVLAQVIANNSAAALDFNDPKVAGETLAALHADNNIASACLYSSDGHAFAVYYRAGEPRAAPPVIRRAGQEFTGGQLRVFLPVKQQSEVVGTLFVASDLKEISSRLMRYLGIVGAVLVASLLLALALSRVLQRLVSDPILHLAQVSRTVALERNYSLRATKQSNDELGQLVDGFNEMLAEIQTRDTALQIARDDLEKRVEERTRELETIHKQLVEASRQAGMSEIAVNVLHNVGNVLNSVNVSTGMLIENAKKSKISSFARVVALLKEHPHDLGEFITLDSRGKNIPAHLAQLSEHLLAEQEINLRELEELRANVEHIKEIVAMQQNYAKFGGVKEMMNIVSLVEHSLLIDKVALNRHGVEVIREFENVPPLNVEKHKIVQILVNLVRNAKHACEDSQRQDKRLTVRVTRAGGKVRISVIDNGVGVPADNLTRIFSHGFTTRKDGHGFGLHSGALSAKEMGGSLTVQSAGPGQGAVFTLELPFPTLQDSPE